MKKYVSFVSAGPIIFSAVLLLGSVKVWAQDNDSNNFDRDTLIAAAREIMERVLWYHLRILCARGGTGIFERPL
jgi:hypothetical protein